MSLILLVNRTSADVITAILNPLLKKAYANKWRGGQMDLPVFDKFHCEEWQRNEALAGEGGSAVKGKLCLRL